MIEKLEELYLYNKDKSKFKEKIYLDRKRSLCNICGTTSCRNCIFHLENSMENYDCIWGFLSAIKCMTDKEIEEVFYSKVEFLIESQNYIQEEMEI